MCLTVTERGFGMTEFGQLLKSLRERRGVSQSKLAERAEFDHSYVSRLEGGARMPTRDAVDRLGDAMDLSEGERDMLLAAAGFLPRDFAKILSAEPVLGEVFYLLSDEQLPAEYRENMRQVLHLLAEQARIAMQVSTIGRVAAAA
jgi:transcriptional regulator with XRE-family HTH domain